MGFLELKHIQRCFGWFRFQASRSADGSRTTDTDEVCSSAIRRMSDAALARPFKDEAQFKAYVSTVMRHAVVDHARNTKRRDAHEQMAAELNEQRRALSQDADGPGADRLDERTRMLEEMMLLDTASRRVMEMHLRGVPSRAIGEQYGLAPSTVRNKIALARREMKQNRTDQDA